MAEATTTYDAESDHHVGYYVVCLIDLLDQKTSLKKWDVMPPNGQLSPSFIAGIKESVGAVLGFYEAFTKYFDCYRAKTPFDQLNHAMMRDSEQALYQRQKEFELGIEQFSDTFVFYAPLANAEREVLVLPVYAILAACGMAMHMSLAAKVPLRGAVHIGTGIKVPELSFYGPALAEVHRLEQEIAQYPRIVASPELVRFVQGTPPTYGCHRIDSMLHSMIQTSRSLLCRDASDNQTIVDFLGDGIRRISGNTPEVKQAIGKAYTFVADKTRHFHEAAESDPCPQNVKMAQRYLLLQQYMLNHLPSWGITPGGSGTTDKGVSDGG